jgi:ribosomal protein S18 acetylase RimI-like enzyme
MIGEDEIVSTLAPLNGTFFNIPDLPEYARKLGRFAKCVCLREEHTNKLMSYVVYYDNGPEIFISMVWTGPDFQRRGLATRLITEIIHSSPKNIKLEVHKNNPARHIYEKLKFVKLEERGDILLLNLCKRLIIMQPYTFPYIGYFHLIESSSLAVFFDDVNYIRGGWINRNRILLNNKEYLFTVPVAHGSQNRLINETLPSIDTKWKDSFHKTLTYAYRKAPYFSDVADMVISVFEAPASDIADLATKSIVAVYDYLGRKIEYTKSSLCAAGTKGMEKADRLIEITKALGFAHYGNAPGGVSLYDKDYFRSRGVELNFIKSNYIEYKQYENSFVPWLSIIDVLMFNDRDRVVDFFSHYTIE